MKTDNRGFTLIEMLVCLVIFGIVVAAAYGLMLTGSLSFNTVNNDTNLQTNADITLNQLGEHIMSCSAGIAFKDSTLYVINRDESGSTYTADIFQYKNDNCIYFSTSKAVLESDGSFSCSIGSGDLLAKNVQSFFVTIVSNQTGTNAVSTELNLFFSLGSSSLSRDRTVALRNRPPLITIS